MLEAADAVARQLGLKYISTDAIVIALVDKAKHPDSVVDFLAKCAAPRAPGQPRRCGLKAAVTARARGPCTRACPHRGWSAARSGG